MRLVYFFFKGDQYSLNGRVDVCSDQATIAIKSGNLTFTCSVEECTPAISSHLGIKTTSPEMPSINFDLCLLKLNAYFHHEVLVNIVELKPDQESHLAVVSDESTNFISAPLICETTCRISGLYR